MEFKKSGIKKTGLQVAGILVLLIALCVAGPAPKAIAQYENSYVSYNDFYQNLAPYGQWIEDPKYGYVWSPNVDGSFRPYYTSGHWAMTDYGNTWISDFPWGWACFHYGRWTFDNYYGWIWIPGTTWGPAWVSWRDADGTFGWSPLDPDYDFSNSFGDYMCPNDWWVFIPYQYLYSGNYYRYWNGPHGNSHIIKNSHFVNNTYENNHITFVSGPRVKDIENSTHKTVPVFHIKNSTNLNTRVHGNEIKMFRPAEIRPVATNVGQRSIPPNVVAAPQPVKTRQAVNAGQTTPPQFRNNIPPENIRQETPGVNINKVAEPAKPTPRYDNNPYEWDVNRSVPQRKAQDRNIEDEENSRQAPAPQRQAPAPQRQAPAPQPAPQRQAQPQQPAPQRQAPAPQPAPQRQAPAPQPQRQAPAPAPQRPAGKR